MGNLARKNRQREDREAGKACPLEPFRVKPHDFGFDPKIDLDKMNSLADELAALDDVRKLKR